MKHSSQLAYWSVPLSCRFTAFSAGAQSFSAWKERKAKVARKEQEQAQAERRRKGVLTGREIFSEVRFASDS